MSITWQIELGRADGTKLRGIDAIAIQKEMSQKFDFFLFFFFFYCNRTEIEFEHSASQTALAHENRGE
jgi:hypothetical protein